jgi:predicted negative regulator of RcsB-dependent stress response
LLQWMPRLRLALIVLVILAFALWFGWGSFLEW